MILAVLIIALLGVFAFVLWVLREELDLVEPFARVQSLNWLRASTVSQKCQAFLLALIMFIIVFEQHMLFGGQSTLYQLQYQLHKWRQLKYAKSLRHCERLDLHAVPRRVFRAFNHQDEAQKRTATATRNSWVAAGFVVRDFDDEAMLAWWDTKFPLRAEFARTWRALAAHPVQRTDFFRLALVWTEGGWWADADVELTVAPELWCLRQPQPFCSGGRSSSSGAASTDTKSGGDSAVLDSMISDGSAERHSIYSRPRSGCGATQAGNLQRDAWQLNSRARSGQPTAVQLVLGVHNPSELVQWTFGAASGNILMMRTMQLIRRKTRGYVKVSDTIAITGPIALTDAAAGLLVPPSIAAAEGGNHWRALYRQFADHQSSKDDEAQEALLLPLGRLSGRIGSRLNRGVAGGNQRMARRDRLRGSGNGIGVHKTSHNSTVVLLPSAALLGEQVFQARYICHHFLGSWKHGEKPWVWRMKRLWHEQFRRPCEYW